MRCAGRFYHGWICYALHLRISLRASATQLNTSADQEYLWRAGDTREHSPGGSVLQLGSGEDGRSRRAIRHKFKTLEYTINCTAGTIDDMSIRYDATTVYSDGDDRSNPYQWIGTINLTSFGLVEGRFIRFELRRRVSQAAASIASRYLRCRRSLPDGIPGSADLGAWGCAHGLPR